MSQSVKLESSSILNPIENILESLSFSKEKSITSNYTAPSISSATISAESITSSLAFKIIIILIVLLAGIIGYTYLEKEVNQWIANIKNYFETKKYTKKEKEHAEEQEKQKEIESENTPKEQTIEDVVKDIQSDIEKNKNKNKNKKEEPINYSASSKLNSSPVEEDVEEYQKDTLQKALNDASQSGGEVVPDGAESGKAGWCFIGADNLSRTCAEIGVNDMCMSGEIYPTKDVCINPRLRA
jgi:hypothetical protein